MKFWIMLFFIFALLAVSLVVKADVVDPTRPLTFQDALQRRCSQGRLLLQSINYGQHEHIALINGAFYEVGDKIEVYKVSAITTNTVTLERDNEKVELTL